jgi:hypothetical protein
MFRRPRTVTTPSPPPGASGAERPTVAFDPWCGDTESPVLQAKMLEGDWKPLAEALRDATPERRDFVIRKVTDQARPTPALDEWCEAEPKSALPFVVRGAQRINSAWAARGRRYTSDVDTTAWQGFQQGLLDAEVDLHRAVRADDKDPLPWIQLLISGRTLGMSIGEASRRYQHIESLHPGLCGAADQIVQCVSHNWLGDQDTMLGVAREIAGGSRPGDPRHRIVATAHLEIALSFGSDTHSRDLYRHDRSVHDELLATVERSVGHPSFGDGPEQRITLSWFAATLGYFHLAEAARPILERIADAPAPAGFEYFGNPMGVYLRCRQAAGLDPAPPSTPLTAAPPSGASGPHGGGSLGALGGPGPPGNLSADSIGIPGT